MMKFFLNLLLLFFLNMIFLSCTMSAKEADFTNNEKIVRRNDMDVVLKMQRPNLVSERVCLAVAKIEAKDKADKKYISDIINNKETLIYILSLDQQSSTCEGINVKKYFNYYSLDKKCDFKKLVGFYDQLHADLRSSSFREKIYFFSNKIQDEEILNFGDDDISAVSCSDASKNYIFSLENINSAHNLSIRYLWINNKAEFKEFLSSVE